MALMSCPECFNEISDKASSCPHCGFPISQAGSQIQETGRAAGCPCFPEDLSLSSVVKCWNGPVIVSGQYYNTGCTGPFTGDELGVILHENGLLVTNKGGTQRLSLHCSQLIEVAIKTEQEVRQMETSVVGRAALGAVLLGPVGAVIGGMSALNKTVVKTKNFLVIHYWDTKTKATSMLLMELKSELPYAFLNKYRYVEKRYKEMSDKIQRDATASELFIDLDNVVKCPSCSAKLRLDENDLRTQSFICPECNDNVVFRR